MARTVLRAALKTVVLGLALFLLLVPKNRVSPWAYPVLFGAPLVYAASRRDAERAFLLWTTYTVSFVTFVVLRRHADSTGIPWLHGYVIGLDRILGFGSLPTVVFQRSWYSADTPSLLDAAAVAVYLSYYLVPPAVGIILWSVKQSTFERYLAAVSATYLIGLVAHFAVPTVPPWMAARLGYIDPVARVLYDRVHNVWPSFYAFGNAVAGGNDVAAMPSLHMATAFLAALGLARIGRVTAALGIAYAVGMGFALVYLGEHYVADLLGGILIGWICWRAAPQGIAWLMQGPPGGPVEGRG